MLGRRAAAQGEVHLLDYDSGVLPLGEVYRRAPTVCERVLFAAAMDEWDVRARSRLRCCRPDALLSQELLLTNAAEDEVGDCRGRHGLDAV